MAEASPVQGLCEETTCSICLEYFKDPVIIDCGHIFCQACLTEYCGKFGADASCPQCREAVQQKNFRPNRQLASIVEIAKKFSLRRLKGAEPLGPVCERHLEPLKLFCQDDQIPICVVCDKSKEHRGHTVIPQEEAFEEYQVKGQAHLEFLKKEREEIWTSRQSGEAEGQTLLEQNERERQKIKAEFKQLHQFLEEQERQLLVKLKDLDDQIKDKWNAHTDKLSEEISAMDLLIKEMEEKQKQPASEFLQGLRNILQQRNKEKFVNPVAFPPKLKQRIENISKECHFLETTINEFKAKFTVGGTCTVPTLVLSTACSPDRVSFGATQQFPFGPPQQFSFAATPKYPFGPTPKYSAQNNYQQQLSQFSCWSYVMGVERINSGSCSWVMNIRDEKFWAVGVALECFRGRSMSCLNPEQGIWAVGQSDGGWYAFTSPGTHPLACPWSSRQMLACPINPCIGTTIRFSLNHEEGSVTFLNADSSVMYAFRNASFSGQAISSWYFMGK